MGRDARGRVSVGPAALAFAMFVTACSGTSGPAARTDDGHSSDGAVTSSLDGSTSSDAPIPSAPADVPVLLDGLVSDRALAAMVVDGVPDGGLIDNAVAVIHALPDDEELVALQDLSHRFELQAARISGLQDAVGSEQATEMALDGAWGKVAVQVDAADPNVPLEPAVKPSGFTQVTRPTESTASGVGALGVLMATMAISFMADPVVSMSNGFTPDQYGETNNSGLSIAAGIEGAAIEMAYDGDQDGVGVKFKTSAAVQTCPDPSGAFTIEAKVDLHTSKGRAGQNVTIDLNISGQVDDDAKLASKQTETRTQWADFGGPTAGQFIDHTYTTGSDGSSNISVSRAGGTVTDSFVSTSVLLSVMYALLVGDKLVGAAEKAWQSGRCVRLDATPSAGPTGLEAGQIVSVLAAPRSKVDGAATGGTVTALLSAGENSVDPSSTPVAADAEFTYTASNEEGKGGTVTLEARSKRGVGKAKIDFTTSAARTVTMQGALNYSFGGLTGTATFSLTMVPDPGGVYSGTAEFQVTGLLASPSTTCAGASWAESLDLTGRLSHENDQDVLIISTIGEAPRGTPVSRVCTTAGISIPSQTSLISSTLIGDLHVPLVDGDQPFVDTLSPATGTITVSIS